MQPNPKTAARKPNQRREARPAAAAAPRRRQRRALPGSSTINAPAPHRLTMPRKIFRKYIPDADAVRSHRLVAAFGRWLHHPNLWHFNRRSVPGAVAVGLFSGLVAGPPQMLTALLVAGPVRHNIPAALLVTLYTNPLTIVPLYVIAFASGNRLLRP